MRTFTQCTECVARQQAELPPLEGRGNLARYGLWAMAAFHVMSLLFNFGQLATGESKGIFTLLSGLATLVSVPAYITTIVLVCRWFHLATRYALARGGQMGVTPAGAVGSWFIPFVNLVKPFNHTRAMFSAAGKSSERVGAWQTMWILGNVTANLSSRFPGDAGVGVNMVSDLVMFGAALVCAKVIDELRFDGVQ